LPDDADDLLDRATAHAGRHAAGPFSVVVTGISFERPRAGIGVLDTMEPPIASQDILSPPPNYPP
jgi:hypothetical protein